MPLRQLLGRANARGVKVGMTDNGALKLEDRRDEHKLRQIARELGWVPSGTGIKHPRNPRVEIVAPAVPKSAGRRYQAYAA